jgi:hypothetical protein
MRSRASWHASGRWGCFGRAGVDVADERIRIPFNRGYGAALGEAVYIFSYLEWGVVYCLEQLRPNYLSSISSKTAGQIARDFLNAAEALPDYDIRKDCVSLADKFYFLVQDRNSLVHSNPATSPTGEQLLFRHGNPWLEIEIAQLSDKFAILAIEVNELYYSKRLFGLMAPD